MAKSRLAEEALSAYKITQFSAICTHTRTKKIKDKTLLSFSQEDSVELAMKTQNGIAVNVKIKLHQKIATITIWQNNEMPQTMELPRTEFCQAQKINDQQLLKIAYAYANQMMANQVYTKHY